MQAACLSLLVGMARHRWDIRQIVVQLNDRIADLAPYGGFGLEAHVREHQASVRNQPEVDLAVRSRWPRTMALQTMAAVFWGAKTAVNAGALSF